MAKDLLQIFLDRKIAEAEEQGDKDRVKALKAKLSAHQKSLAKVEAEATSAEAEPPKKPDVKKKEA